MKELLMPNTKKTEVEMILSKQVMAVVGVSKNPQKFGSQVYLNLKSKGYTVYGVNPGLSTFDGDKIYGTINELPDTVEAIVTVVPPAITSIVVKEVHAKGIKAVWMQQGSESQEAIDFCQTNGITVIHNQCVMMFVPPVSGIHSLHRGFKKLFGGLPV
jgi:predicted CoA-binding protein